MPRPVETAAFELSITGRWDARLLARRLASYHSFLVQYEPEGWVLHGRAPGSHGERLRDALSAIEHWMTERHLEDVSLKVDGRQLRLPQRQKVLLRAVGSHRSANLGRRRRQGGDSRVGSFVA
jgi:hypothetical protein